MSRALAAALLQAPLRQNAWAGTAAGAGWLARGLVSDAEQLGPDAYTDSFKSPVASLQFNRGEVMYPPQLEGNILGRGLLRLVGAYSEKQLLKNGASVLHSAITEAAEDELLQQALGLEPGRFMTPHCLLVLHMWLVINRLHGEPDQRRAKIFRDMLYLEFHVKDVERRVHAAGVTVHVSKWLKKLEQQFYGSCMAYDRALRREGGVSAQQAAFVDALLKNVYDDDAGRRPWASLLARYLTRELQCLQATELDAVYRGQIRFSRDVVVKAPGGAR